MDASEVLNDGLVSVDGTECGQMSAVTSEEEIRAATC